MSGPKRTNLFMLGLLILGIVFQVSPLVFKGFDYRFVKGFTEVLYPGIVVLLFFLITREKPREVFQFHRVDIRNIGYIVLMTLLIYPLIGIVSGLTQLVLPNPLLRTSISSAISRGPLWLALLTIAVQPAVLEELCFRGIIRHGYRNVPLRTQALVVGVFFGIFHLNFSQVFYAAVLGIFMIYVFYYTRSILSTMLVHLLINGSSVTLSHVISSRLVTQMQNTATTPHSAGSVIALLVTFVFQFCLYFPLYHLAFRSFVTYNKKRLGLLNPPQYAYYPVRIYQGPLTSPPFGATSIPERSSVLTPGVITSIEEAPNQGQIDQRTFTPLFFVIVGVFVGFATFIQVYSYLVR